MSDVDRKVKNPRIEQAGASDENIQNVHAILMREKQEPAEGYSPMPLFLLGFISAMILIVAVYFVHNRGGIGPAFSFKKASLVYDERFDPKKGISAGGSSAVVDPVLAGKKLYNQICAACHQPNGLGTPGAFPPLAKSEWVSGSDERLINILLHGLSGELKVSGATFNGNMPNFGPGGGYNWSDEKIANVITYIRQEWGNSSSAITASAVTAVRTKAANARNKPWTQEELLALP